jgi:hypothetical protein
MNAAMKCSVCGHDNATADSHLSPEEREEKLTFFEVAQERMYSTGKTIVFTIATINIVLSVISFFIEFNFLPLAVQIALSIALYRGVRWVRYLFAAGAVLSVILILYLLTVVDSDMSFFLVGFFIFMLVYSISSALLLFANKSVGAFLYAQKNG